MRTAGKMFREIGEHLGVSEVMAYKYVIDGIHRTLQEPADELRKVEIERLDRCLAAVWEKALKGDVRSIEVVLKIAERRSRFLGLDAPQRQEIVGTLEILLQELEEKRNATRIAAASALPLPENDAIPLEALGPRAPTLLDDGNGNGNGAH